MKILKVIHGYPPAYNAGSEVYSQTLCEALSQNHEVYVFTREENPFLPDYDMRVEKGKLTKYLINIPLLRQRYRYSHPEVDRVFEDILETINPDVVHIGHLNHLSTTIIPKISRRRIPIVYTLHDYWLICARGQFLQRNPQTTQDLWPLCEGQGNEKCAKNCYAGYFSGLQEERNKEIAYWTDWFRARMDHIRDIVTQVDLFIAPSQYLLKKYKDFFNLSSLVYMDYGFDLERFIKRQRVKEDKFVFGYMGTHTPQKGIHHLIEAFGKVKSDSYLRIWGRERGEVTPALKSFVHNLPLEKRRLIDWRGEYNNKKIVEDVFNHTDAIVVPSIWEENSPLVIHEAQQMKVPVITANSGGMAEYVHHGVNGLLFDHRNSNDLAKQMEWLAKNLAEAETLGKRGYIYSDNIPDIKDQVKDLENIYKALILEKRISK